jgi:hypothetical protein
MAYQADPGGVFASDTHRRTLAHLTSDAMSLEDLYTRMIPDASTDFDDEAELAEVLSDLEADGYASETAAGWKQTKRGLDALNAPVPEAEE